MSVPSTRSFFSGEDSISALYVRTGRRFAYTPSVLRMPSRPFLRPLFRRRVVELGQADRAHQRRVGFQRQASRSRPETACRSCESRCRPAALRVSFSLCLNFCADVLEHPHGFARDFRADAVARHDRVRSGSYD